MGTRSARLLVIEDEAALRAALTATLTGEHYTVRAEADGTRVREAVEAFRPDLAILDVRLPLGPSGLSLTRLLQEDEQVPVILLTAAGSPTERLAGFDAGADDYLVKPFVMTELLARVQAVLRRRGTVRPDVWQVGDLVVDEERRRVHRDGHEVELTRTEFDLLVALGARPDRVLSKAQLIDHLWGLRDLDVNVVEVHVSALRRKLEAHGPRLIQTVRGAGYRLRSAPARHDHDGEARPHRLVDDAAHQLRAPITTVRACADALLRDPPPEIREELLGHLLAETGRAERLVDSMLAAARYEHGGPPELVAVDPVPLCREEAERCRAATPHLDVEVTVGRAPARTRLDPTAVREAVANLLDNASRHAGRRIEVIVDDDAGRGVRIRVVDDGPGVPDEARERIFERFVTLDGGGGSGLGLSIARTIAEAHGGSLGYEEGGFLLRLPAAGRQGWGRRSTDA